MKNKKFLWIITLFIILAIIFWLNFLNKTPNNIQKNNRLNETFKLGKPRGIKGSSCVLLPLYYKPNGLLKSIGSGYSYPTRNLLFINNKTDTQSWLFKDKHFLILEYIFLPKQEFNEKREKVDAILYKLIKKDSNGDGELSVKDLKTIAISKPDGSGYKEILNGINDYLGEEYIDRETLIVLYQRGEKAFFRKIKIKTLEISKEREIKLPL